MSSEIRKGWWHDGVKTLIPLSTNAGRLTPIRNPVCDRDDQAALRFRCFLLQCLEILSTDVTQAITQRGRPRRRDAPEQRFDLLPRLPSKSDYSLRNHNNLDTP